MVLKKVGGVLKVIAFKCKSEGKDHRCCSHPNDYKEQTTAVSIHTACVNNLYVTFLLDL